MSFEADLKSHLQGDSTLGSLVADRVTPVIRPAGGALPAVTFHRIAGAPLNSLLGHTNDGTRYRTQIDCWGQTHESAHAVANAVRSRMNTYTSALKSVLNFDQDDYEPDTRLYHVIMDYSCRHTA